MYFYDDYIKFNIGIFFRIYFYSFIKMNKDYFIHKIIKNTVLKLKLEILKLKLQVYEKNVEKIIIFLCFYHRSTCT